LRFAKDVVAFAVSDTVRQRRVLIVQRRLQKAASASNPALAGSRLRPDVRAFVLERLASGHGPTAITEAAELEGYVVSVRTVAAMKKQVPPPDPGERWTLIDPDVDRAELPHGIDALRVAIRESEGRRSFVTKAEAHAFAAVRTAVPGIPARHAWRLALRLLTAREEEVDAVQRDVAHEAWDLRKRLEHEAAVRGMTFEQAAEQAADDAARRAEGSLAPGQRYETEYDLVEREGEQP